MYPGLALHFVAQAQHSLGQFEAAAETLKRRLERDPKSETGYALLASCYGHLGQIDESRSAWAEVMRIAPDFSVERRWGTLPFRESSQLRAPHRGLAQSRPSRIAHSCGQASAGQAFSSVSQGSNQRPDSHKDDDQGAYGPERRTRFVRLSGEICREMQKSRNDVTIEEQAREQERWLS